MYLTKLLLNPANQDAWRDVSSPYDMHRSLQRAFPNGEPDENRLLFRVEPWRPGMRGVPVLVQSSTARPDWSFVEARNDAYCLDVQGPKRVNPQLQSGQQLAFRLLGNATKKSQGKRIALCDEEDYHEWLRRKADQSGFQVLQMAASSYWINEEHLSRSPDDGYDKRNIPHFAVRYDGVLQVTDSDQLRSSIAAGIGPAKAFGFGLLSLAPAR